MAPKRPRPEEVLRQDTSRKQHKITQRRDARKIDTDSRPSPGQSSAPSNASTTVLPPQLDVEQTIAARRFQIQALQRAIRASRASASTRAWQLLPRHARRRAASHNILRLPARLRRKGLAELRASNTNPKTRSEMRKRLATHPRSKSLARKEELLQRAARPGAQWLETHLWYAKRFRMSRADFDGPRWGYVLPEERSMKGARTDWRAANQGCAVLDASYEEWFRLSCKVARSSTSADEARQYLQEVVQLANIRQASSKIGPQLLPGTVVDAVLHAGNPGPSDQAICPLTIYSVAPTEPRLEGNTSGGKRPRLKSDAQQKHRRAPPKSLRKMLASLQPAPPLSEVHPDFEVLVRVHPAATRDVTRALRKGIAKRELVKLDSLRKGTHFVLTGLSKPDAGTLIGIHRPDEQSRKERRKASDKSSMIERQQLRSRAFNIFELYGPLSGQVLDRVLSPVLSTTPGVGAGWPAFAQGSRPTMQLDRGLVFNLLVTDPRLSTPTNRRAQKASQVAAAPDFEALDSEGKGIIAANILSDGKSAPRFSKGDLDRRRAKQLVPGSRRQPTAADDTVPVLVVMRSVLKPIDDVEREVGGYTLIVPQGWGSAFFQALVGASARPLSQQSLRSLHLETATPSYPYDWVGSPGWADALAFNENKRLEAWTRLPKGKRTEWKSVGTRWPFGGQGMWTSIIANARAALLALLPDSTSAQHSIACRVERVHLMGSSDQLIEQVQRLQVCKNSGAKERPKVPAAILPPMASTTTHPFVLFSARAIDRGRLHDGDEVHLLSAATKTTPTSHIGTITSGNFSLARGTGFGLGVAAREAWICAALEGQGDGNAGGAGAKEMHVRFLVRSRIGGPAGVVEANAVTF
ncbi:POP1-domain-containing protein [Microstroma glucosiphilum]|uniref:POP1-domain-containing protein n=1 Tax=Pseudomicrostroma glucosiphilum TaxID=1684307 RepID=A0A316U3Q2_9BASI|nr:POP1-domain-containing protein [Pseudomicrostroma glucosiphilum]PWN19867.1 POP1-domain-containing protein [Pseudomicrostroma glucosiphilum]